VTWFPAAQILEATPDRRFRRMVVNESRLRTAMLGYAPGDRVHLHAHLDSDEIFYVVAGHARFVVDDRTIEAAPGDLLHIRAGGRHAFWVHDEPLVLLAVVAPNLDDAWVPDEERRS
jgi:mannose-6-phosphate isomerase-like protein (cupin superfamily)